MLIDKAATEAENRRPEARRSSSVTAIVAAVAAVTTAAKASKLASCLTIACSLATADS